ncbi:MAG: RluA family pseudouridine synthase [Treponema sp.]|jgi:23S rRNA pseudouridine1911/1915/1917 synthase|nr:RluA family pseudouridine synthase [Treponema sp.]
MPVFSGTVEDTAGIRLDRYVSECLGLLSRSQVKSRSLTALVNGKQAKRSRVVQTGDRLELSWDEAESQDIEPEDIPLTVLYEDSRVIVIDKAQGMVVHPGAGNHSGTLVNALLFRRTAGIGSAPAGRPGLAPVPGDPLRPGIVHRLDKDTSGVMICAWDIEALAFLSGQFKARTARKQYVAVLRGVPAQASGRIKTPIRRDSRDRKRFAVGERGKEALSYFKLVRSWGSHSLVLLYPRTGRTHQLRVHMAYLGHPIVGDALYGARDRLFPGAAMMLHARNLSVTLPGEHEPRIFTSPLPDRFRPLFRVLEARAGGACPS